MEEVKRVSFTSGQKVALWFGAAIIVWIILEKLDFANAFWTFCLSGKLPWSNTVLAPETVMKGAFGALAVLLITPCAIYLAKKVHQKRQQVKPVNEVKAPAIASHSYAEPILFLDITEQDVKKAQAKKVRIAKRHKLNPVALNKLFQFALDALHVVTNCALYLYVMSRKAMWYESRIVIKIGLRTIHTLRRLWSWLSPYLWQFDHWLEAQTKAAVKHSRKKVRSHETFYLILNAVALYFKKLTRF